MRKLVRRMHAEGMTLREAAAEIAASDEFQTRLRATIAQDRDVAVRDEELHRDRKRRRDGRGHAQTVEFALAPPEPGDYLLEIR